MLAIKDSTVFEPLPFPNDLEIISVEIEATFVLCLIYRPPNCAGRYSCHISTHCTTLRKLLSLVI